MNDLEKKIAELTAKHNFEVFAQELIGDIKHNAVYGTGVVKPFISVHCKNCQELNELLERLTPVNEYSEIGTPRDNYYQRFESPYTLELVNPCRVNQWTDYELKIDFKIAECGIWLQIPVSELDYNFRSGSRKITESEYHYFEGLSYRELASKTVQTYEFKSRDMQPFYGGRRKLYCLTEINDILTSIKSK